MTHKSGRTANPWIWLTELASLVFLGFVISAGVGRVIAPQRAVWHISRWGFSGTRAILLVATCLAVVPSAWSQPQPAPFPPLQSDTDNSANGGQFIELVVPLDEDQSYSLREFYRECNDKLGTSYQLALIPDHRIRIGAQEKRLLRLLSRSGLANDDVQVRVDPHRLVLRLPNPENDATRREFRRRTASLLGVPLEEWPAEKGLHLPADFDPGVRTVLLSHGLESNAKAMQGLARACRSWGVQTLSFDYPNDGPLATVGERLHRELSWLTGKHPRLQMAIVAHSMGGLVVRYALEVCQPPPGCVTDVFMLGTPHQGAPLSNRQPWLELVLETLPNLTDRRKTVRDGLGEAAEDLQPGSLFLRKLDAKRRPAGVHYHTAIGSKGLLNEQELDVLRRRLDDHLKQRDAPVLQRARLAGFLQQADALCTGKGDGAVTIESAHLDGADSERTFELSHLELIEVPVERPEEAPVFQWIVQTLRWRPQ